AFGVAEFVQPIPRRFTEGRCRQAGQQNAKVSYLPNRLLRARRERPRGRCSTEQGDELATAAHSITSSARASRVAATSRPSALAVLRLITSSNFVGCSTGRSEGLAPFRRRPA